MLQLMTSSSCLAMQASVPSQDGLASCEIRDWQAVSDLGKLSVQTCTACHAASAASPSCWKACGAMVAAADRPTQRQAEMASAAAPGL